MTNQECTERSEDTIMTMITRRNFLKNSLAATAAASLPASVWVRAAGANDTIRVAVVGIRGRGAAHISGLSGLPGVQVVALCDVDSDVLAKGAANFE